MLIHLDTIKIDGGTQSRAKLDESVVADYAELILAGTDLPPVIVFHDGKAHWLADGFHRFHAHRKAYAAEIDADVRTGTKRDAILFSVGANAGHGLRRTNDDKRCSVKTLLADKEWGAWSDREIAKACGVSVPFVGAVRRPEVAQKQQENRASHAAGCSSTTPPPTDNVSPPAALGCNPITPLPAAESDSCEAADSALAAPSPEAGIPALPANASAPVDLPKVIEITYRADRDAATRHAREVSKAAKTVLAEIETGKLKRSNFEKLRESVDAIGVVLHLEPRSPAVDAELEDLRASNAELAYLVKGTTFTDQGSEAAAREIARLEAMVNTLQSRRDGLMTTNAEMARQMRTLQNKVKRLEKAQGDAGK